MVVIAGPNGSGKSTSAPALLRDSLGVEEFVNADRIAEGLSAFRSDTVAIQAGRIMLQRMRDLAARRSDFAFETTLASRSFAPWLAGLKTNGYRVHIVFLWLSSPELAMARVANRVREGGHGVAEDVIRRRYGAGLRNLFQRYQPISDSWFLLDSSGPDTPRLIARRTVTGMLEVADEDLWTQLQARYA